ncbi:MAG: hypothetical protein K2R98_21870 [Gemmataceae bacterium]|nr:hypothetical protein [Gemmataceae bacterium]
MTTFPPDDVKRMPASERPRLVAMIVLTVLEGLALLPMLLVALMGAMAFDAPGSEKMASVWAIFLTLWALPGLVVVFNVTGWVMLTFRRRRWALILVAVAGCIQLAAYTTLGVLMAFA